MGDCDDDVFFCDDCGGIFLSTRELELHNSSEHGAPALLQASDSNEKGEKVTDGEKVEEKKKKKAGPASRVQRDKSSSDEEDARVESKPKSEDPVKKKPKMGPASQVKRDVSPSSERGEITKKTYSSENKEENSKSEERLKAKVHKKS